MDIAEFYLEAIRKQQQFHAHMDQFYSNFLKGKGIQIQTRSRSEKSVKKERDPDAPKKPLTAFFIFNAKYREKAIEKHPELKPTDTAQMAGKAWKNMGEEERAPYVEKAEQEKQKYEISLKEYNQKHGIESTDKKKKKQDKSDSKSIQHELEQEESVQESVPQIIQQKQKSEQVQKTQGKKKQVEHEPVEEKKTNATKKQTQSKPKSVPKNLDEIQKETDLALKKSKK